MRLWLKYDLLWLPNQTFDSTNIAKKVLLDMSLPLIQTDFFSNSAVLYASINVLVESSKPP